MHRLQSIAGFIHQAQVLMLRQGGTDEPAKWLVVLYQQDSGGHNLAIVLAKVFDHK
jgi:hypothetical protein